MWCPKLSRRAPRTKVVVNGAGWSGCACMDEEGSAGLPLPLPTLIPGPRVLTMPKNYRLGELLIVIARIVGTVGQKCSNNQKNKKSNRPKAGLEL
eukprot:1695274-Amphidinium_carterae.1